MQNQIENDSREDDEPVDSLYVGSNEIKVAVEKLKAELSLARLDTKQTINDSKDIEETIEANQIETSGNEDEIIVLENQENEPSMDC